MTGSGRIWAGEEEGGKIHEVFPTLRSIASLTAVPRLILAAGFCAASGGTFPKGSGT